MEKIIILKIDENGDVIVMDKTKVKLSKSVLEEIADTYKKLNITEKREDISKDYSEIFRYDNSKKTSIDINSNTNV